MEREIVEMYYLLLSGSNVASPGRVSDLLTKWLHFFSKWVARPMKDNLQLTVN